MRDKLIQTKELLKGVNYSIELNDKVDDFIDFYRSYLERVGLGETEIFSKPKRLRDFIEKVAVWYEEEYTKEDVECFIHEFSENNKAIEVFDLQVFIKENNLNGEFLLEPKYPNTVYIDSANKTGEIKLNKTGGILSISNVRLSGWLDMYNDFYKGFTLESFIDNISKEYLDIPSEDEIRSIIRDYKNQQYIFNNILECVMYRIIERGGKHIGPRRGFMFAIDFNTDIDIPLIYGMDRRDENMEEFIRAYHRIGDSLDLECLDGYFNRTIENEILNTITIKEYIKNIQGDNDIITDSVVIENKEENSYQKVIDGRPVVV